MTNFLFDIEVKNEGSFIRLSLFDVDIKKFKHYARHWFIIKYLVSLFSIVLLRVWIVVVD